jgi:hypothetical protein
MAKHTYNGLTIEASNICPPIPTRGHDWSAHVDNWGADSSPTGYGETEADAIFDLIIQIEEEG